MTERSGDGNRPDRQRSERRPAQPSGEPQRSSDVSGQSARAELDPRSSSADTLMASNLPEEGAVDQRADPSTWFGNGSASRPPDPQMHAGSQPDESSYMGAEPQGGRYQESAGPAPDEGDGHGGSHYQRPAAPPYPAQIPPPPQSTGVAAKVTAQLAALTKPRPRSAPPRMPRPTPTARSPRATVASRPMVRTAGPTRRAQLVLSRIEPWSVMKFSFLVSLVGWVVLFVAVTALYYVLSKLGVFHSIEATITNVTSTKGSTGADSGGQWFSFSRVIGYTMLIGAINVVLITALATVGAVIYNLVTHLAGGIEVTLRESD
jgi:Transmembrane domain of unknown function (DUF3566)